MTHATSSPVTTTTQVTPKKPNKLRRYLQLAALTFVLFALCNPCSLAMGIRIAAAEPFEIEGPSMAPNFQSGDRIVVSKFPFGLFLPFTDEAIVSWGGPSLGDVVILHTTAADIDVLKRVVGLPGDTIEVRDRVLIRNGHPVTRRAAGSTTYDEDVVDCIEETLGTSSYVVLETPGLVPADAAETTVPAGHYYVLGDYRHRSNDSRYIGTVAQAQLKGRFESVYFSNPQRLSCASPAEAQR